MAPNALLKNTVPIEEWMVAITFVKYMFFISNGFFLNSACVAYVFHELKFKYCLGVA